MGTVIATFVASSIGVSAASLRDVFNAEYYASANPDVQAVYGNDVDALFNHYLQHGLKEGRKANPLFDVAKYRETYADLDAAFGDNWDAYVNHYFPSIIHIIHPISNYLN